MKKLVSAVFLLFVGALSVMTVFAQYEKVAVCHVSPGNVARRQVRSVEFDSVIDHLAHGDNVGKCQPLTTVPYYEIFDCDNWKYSILEGEEVGFQHGIGFGTLEQAIIAREGEEVFFSLNDSLLEPVSYEGITLHSKPDFYGDRGRTAWTAEPGDYIVESWWSHPNEGPPADVCEFTVNTE